MNFFHCLRGWTFVARLSLLLCAILVQGCMSAPSWRVDTTLDVVYDQPEPAIRKIERNVHFYSNNRAGMPVRHLAIETEIRTSFRWGEKGTDGMVSVKAWRYRDKTPEGDAIYTFESEGVGVAVEMDFIVIEAFDELTRSIYRYYDIHTGEFLFESYGAAARMSFSLESTGWTPATAGFSPFSPQIPPSLRGQNHVVGVLAYILHKGVLSESLLMADDSEEATGLASAVDQHHRLMWIDRKTGGQPDPVIADKNVNLKDVVLRLRFRDSAMDLDFPVMANGFDYTHLHLPKGLSLVPLERKR